MIAPAFLYRHGDVLLALVSALPADARPAPGLILAHGELTGHAHRIRETGVAQLFTQGAFTYLRASATPSTRMAWPTPTTTRSLPATNR
ncbi:hypothetical protein GKZ68_00005 [Hymenobacter sp. BRD128]|uniref:hypothetical protein n=1 Tax=Hymenobacter sp. BRD128 TaxID=2675878 RepID=UPI00156325FF|nr:hypothetical protein [Hymenobacter sp. BRD128]QKG58782.1 hypothetical protein GKZ68_00005 [Hymenobacter sp. BRD128]